MNKIFQNTVILVLAFISFKSVFAQSLNVSDLKEGEIYFADKCYDSGIEHIFKLKNAKYNSKFAGYQLYGQNIEINYQYGKVYNHRYEGGVYGYFWYDGCVKIRHATQEEKDWLNACIEANEFIPKEEALKTSSKNRGEIKTAQLSLNPADRNSPKFKGNRNGFCFSPVYFNYQFVNCGGEVQMGVNIYTNPQANYQKHTASNGYMFEGEHYVAVVSSTNEVDIQEVEADLYYGNQFLGKINLNYIVGNFAGCYGETFQVLKDVGKDPTAKEYRENLDKFELKNIRILRGDLKISDKEREQIHKSLKYDQFGNPRNPGSNPTQNTQKKYDAFGNEIKSNNSGNTQKKYDAFGNPIKN